MKDVRFTEKKVDESWKEQASREKTVQDQSSAKQSAPSQSDKPAKKNNTSKEFANFINSLAVQALVHLGEMPNPATQVTEVNVDAVREIIDLLNVLKEKTSGNLSDEEQYFFDHFLPDLQLKFASKV